MGRFVKYVESGMLDGLAVQLQRDYEDMKRNWGVFGCS